MIQIFKKEVQNLHIKPSTVIFNILFHIPGYYMWFFNNLIRSELCSLTKVLKETDQKKNSVESVKYNIFFYL